MPQPLIWLTRKCTSAIVNARIGEPTPLFEKLEDARLREDVEAFAADWRARHPHAKGGRG